MPLTLRERLAHLIAAAEAPCVKEAASASIVHPLPTARYLRQFQRALGLPETASRIDCFEALGKKARKLDQKLEATGAFPAPKTAIITTRHQAEASMSYLSATYVGGASKAEQDLMAVLRIGMAKTLDRATKARNLLAVLRYSEGDFHFSPRPAERVAAKAIDLVMPHVTDYWTDLLVIDRDAIVDHLGRGESMCIWVKAGGWGTWVSHKPENIPDDALTVVLVEPSGAKLLRRAKQLNLAA